MERPATPFTPDAPLRGFANPRHRLIAISGAAGLSGGIFYARIGSDILGLPPWLFAGLLYAAVIGLSAAIIFRFAPRFAGFVELTALSRLLIALTAAQAPDLAAAMTLSPALNATLVVAGAVAIRTVAASFADDRRGMPRLALSWDVGRVR